MPMPQGYDENSDAASWIGGIGGAIPGLNIITPGLTQLLSGGAERAARGKALEGAEKLFEYLPNFEERDYDQVGYAGDFNPAMYDTPEAAAYQTINEDPATRAIEMEALQRLAQQGSDAADAGREAGYFQAMDKAARMANQREGAIRTEMERKGQGGTGAAALMKAQAAQMGANRAQAGTLDATSKAALEKLAAMRGAIGAAGAVRGEDFRTAAANSDIINEFNKFNTSARNLAEQRNVDLQNSAGLRNKNTVQGLLGTNAGLRNSSMDRRDRNAVTGFNLRAGATDRVGNILTGAANSARQNGQDANAAGAQGYSNFKDLASFAAGGMGGGAGGMMGGMGDFMGEDGPMKVGFR